MEPWIAITIAAAFAQNLRFMLQKHLKMTQLSVAGATFARFVWSAPLIALIVMAYMQIRGVSLPAVKPVFWAYAVVGGWDRSLALSVSLPCFHGAISRWG